MDLSHQAVQSVKEATLQLKLHKITIDYLDFIFLFFLFLPSGQECNYQLDKQWAHITSTTSNFVVHWFTRQ